MKAMSRRDALFAGIAVLGAGIGVPAAFAAPPGRRGQHFAFAGPDVPEGFLLDGAPFQIRSGELHPARIPRSHWLHRIRMAKAMGMNTIAIYVMWNHHEVQPGRFDFSSGNRDLAHFIGLCAKEGLYVYLRPGPYVCAEWDLGGLPAWLLRHPDIRLRDAGDPIYMAAARRYIARLAQLVRPLMSDRGGPIVMVQVENEYASFGTDASYLPAIRKIWEDEGIAGPFSISDGLQQIRKVNTYLPGAALGLDGDTDFAAAKLVTGGAPVWVGEGYPGWLTHWGEQFATGDYRETLRMLMRERISFNLYVIHGGTNFGWGAGANAHGDGSKFEPAITSYDYGAPINERGAPTAQYHDLRRIIHDALGKPAPAIPASPPTLSFEPVTTSPIGSVWNALPAAIETERPKPMELLSGQTTGVILYRTWLAPDQAGDLRIDGLHDEALVLIDGERLGSLSRVAAAKMPASLALPPATKAGRRRLDILVFPYGRVNYGRYMSDRKGILGAVTIDGHDILHWQAFGLPLDAANLGQIGSAPPGEDGFLHGASFTVSKPADTFLDMSGWGLGLVWVNGHLLGRHSSLGPQTRLYCPGEWLQAGANRIVVFDVYAKPGRAIVGVNKSDTETIART